MSQVSFTWIPPILITSGLAALRAVILYLFSLILHIFWCFCFLFAIKNVYEIILFWILSSIILCWFLFDENTSSLCVSDHCLLHMLKWQIMCLVWSYRRCDNIVMCSAFFFDKGSTLFVSIWFWLILFLFSFLVVL